MATHHSSTEVRAVRHALIVSLLCALAGCSTAPKTPTAAGGESLPPREFVGSPAPVEREGTPGSLAARPLGMLAGQVVDADGRRVANASIQVLELDAGRPRARLSVSTDRNGYFDIPGLEKGRRYQLVATVDRTGGQYVGSATATASNVRVAIYLTENRAGGIPAAPATEGTPPASLGAPVRPTDGTSKASDLPPITTTDPTRTAGGERREDLLPSAPAAVPGPGRELDDTPSRKPLIPPPPITPETGITTPLPGASSPTPVSPLRSERETPGVRVIPACAMLGQRVRELALYDSAGQPWELSDKVNGRLVLLDFWKVGCPPCRAALPKLTEWQAKYGAQGLQIVGVLCDKGTRESRNKSLVELTSKMGLALNYPILFSDEGDCPVRRNLEVSMYPTLILLDDTGKIVWRGVGYTGESAAELELKIKRLLSAKR